MHNKKRHFFLIYLIATSCFVLTCNSDNNQESSSLNTKQEKPNNELVLKTQTQLLEEYLNESNNLITEKDNSDNIEIENKNINYSSIRPILKLNCYPCHRPNGPAPFSLMDYETVKKKSLAISDVLREGIMPPWKADNTYSKFTNAPPMSIKEKNQLLYWLNNSCRPGEIEELNPPILPKLYLSLKNKKEYKITSNEDSYVYTRFDPNLSKNIKLSYLDYSESNPSIVHHRTLFIDTTGTLLDQEKSQKEYDIILNELIPFTAWSKGMIPCELTDNFYYNVPAKSKFLLQTHYQGDGNVGKIDRFSLNLYESSSDGHEIQFNVNNKLDILYPANEVMTETISCFIEDSISILGIIPHMHYLCKKVECYAVFGNEKINLLKIPEWDYYFQGQYILKNPKMIPAGSTVYMDVVIDNSDKNVYQPNNPIRDVIYAQSSNDEMLTLVLIHTKSPVDQSLEIAKPIYR